MGGEIKNVGSNQQVASLHMDVNNRNIRYASNSIGVATTVLFSVPIIALSTPFLAVCAMAADSPNAGMREIYSCMGLWALGAGSIVTTGVFLGLAAKKVTEIVHEHFFLDKVPTPQSMQNAIKA